MYFEIREARPSDISNIIRLCRSHAQFERADYCESNKMESLSQLLFGPDRQLYCLVVESVSSVVGYTTFVRQYSTWEAESYLYVDCLYLETEFRGIGIGRQILHRLQSEAVKRQCNHLQWQTPPSNTKAIEFYEKSGATGKPRVRFKWLTNTQRITPSLSPDNTRDKA